MSNAAFAQLEKASGAAVAETDARCPSERKGRCIRITKVMHRALVRSVGFRRRSSIDSR